MNIRYKGPQVDDKRIKFSGATQMHEPIKVHSYEEYVSRRGNLLDVSDKIHQYLADLALPQGVEGQANLNFRTWISRAGLFGPTWGLIGYPSCSIQTNFGESGIYFWPGEKSYESFAKKGGLYIEVVGGGLAEKVATDLKDEFFKIFKPEETREERYSRKGLDIGRLTLQLMLR
jgi:hypothetical protein